MNKNNYAVIMAGGIGSRFWPMSKVSLPKQFLDILGTGETLIQQTFRRLQKICPTENILIVTNKNYKTLCQEQLADVVEKNILCEPAMRNTAPCVAYAAFKIQSENPDANMIIAASDHIITKEDEFVGVVNDCLELSAANDVLLTIGITPSRPDTGYGYIQFTEQGLVSHKKVRKVKTFTEKPNQELALNFLDSGDFLWNSGNNKRVMYRQYSNVFLITQLNNLEAYAAFLVGDGLMRFCVTVVGYLWVHLPDFFKHVSQAYVRRY